MLPDLDREATSRVFSKSRRMIAFGFYDGPVSGVLHDLGTNLTDKSGSGLRFAIPSELSSKHCAKAIERKWQGG